MPNVLLTNRCNQKCSYCFAFKQARSNSLESSLKNIDVVLDFLKKSNNKNVR